MRALRLSPDGQRVAFIAPMRGQGTARLIRSVGPDDPEGPIVATNGDPQRLTGCTWIPNDRLACRVYGLLRTKLGITPFSRAFAVAADGSNIVQLSTREDHWSRGWQMGGGSVIDWLADDDNAVLTTRHYLPHDRIGSRIGSTAEGLGVDRMNTRSGASTRVEPPRLDAVEHISDGRGNVGIMGVGRRMADGYSASRISYFYCMQGSREWQPLGDYASLTDEGFNPYAVDPDRNVAYGYRRIEGRFALIARALDGTDAKAVVLQRPDVDVGGPVRVGRAGRVVGVSDTTDMTTPVYFDEDIARTMEALHEALPNTPQLRIVDSSHDGQTLLIWAGAGNDAGVHYLFDRRTSALATFLVSRPALEGKPLARVTPVTYPARDGVRMPGYLTLPPGASSVRGRPSILLPHGGPSTRDVWGFDCLSHFCASQGYAVLRPSFRGLAGYGEAWLQENGFRSSATAIADIADGARWLVAEGADARRLGIVG